MENIKIKKTLTFLLITFLVINNSFAQETTIFDVFEFVPGAPQNKSELMTSIIKNQWGIFLKLLLGN